MSSQNDRSNAWSQRPSDYQADPLAAPTPTRTLLGTETILIVDDDHEVRRGISSVLRRFGFTVLEACSGAEAVKVAEREQGPIHLVLADVVMPGLTTEQLREKLSVQLPNAAVIFMSGYIHDDAVRRRVLHGPVPFLPKPFTSMDLVRNIRTQLDERRN